MTIELRNFLLGGITCLAAMLASGAHHARAQSATGSGPGGSAAPQQSPTPGGGAGNNASGSGNGLFASSRSTLLGDLGNVRSALGNDGVFLGLTETSEVLGNVSGGIRQGADYDGLTLMSAGLDTQKAFGWDGGTFNFSALQIHGRNLAADNLDNLQTPSGIEANRATRLWEAWYQQSFLDGRADLRLGQQSLDQEFMGSQYSGLFINTMMGWPLVPSYDLYAGGPAYPLSSLGVRARAQLPGAFTVLGGVFDDNPAGGPFDDDNQLRGAEQSGTKFNTGTGALFVGELQYALNQPSTGDMDEGNNKHPGLPGTYKLGAWYDTAGFPDQRIDTIGLSLNDPNSNGVAQNRHHNYSIYGVVDQMVWRADAQSSRALGVFARAMGATGDRNLIAFSLNTGVSLKAPLPGRNGDSFGLGYGIGQVSGTAGALDKDLAYYSGTASPKRSSESFIEVTYQCQVAPWWQVQPDAQYVFLPGAGIADPNRAGKRISNETILGIRTNVTF